MLTYTEIHEKNAYFAGANTSEGFKEEYSNFISEDSFEKVYIIKGGSGTGKSTLIRRAKEAGKAEGAKVTVLLCSSDPDSLDGVIIEKGEKRIAVIDGTAPHSIDPKYPGACGELINCGECWRSSVLEGKKQKIGELYRRKGENYQRAYKFLACGGEIARMEQRLSEYVLEKEKMQRAVMRLAESMGGEKEQRGRLVNRRTYALTMKGAYRTCAFEGAERMFFVNDCSKLTPIFMKMLSQALEEMGYCVYRSLSPIYGIREIYVPGADAAFVAKKESAEHAKVINLRRFADKERLREVRQRRSFLRSCMSAVTSGALESLGECRPLHFALEEIYKEAMDFSGMDALGDELCREIGKRL